MVRLWSNSYSGIPQHTDDKQADDFDEDEPTGDVSTDRQEGAARWSKNKFLILSVVLQLVLFFASVAFFVAASLKRSGDYSTPGARGGRSSERAPTSLWTPSPLTLLIAIGSLVSEYHPQRFQLEYIHTPYRGPPSPAVDKAWEELTEGTFYPSTRSEDV